MVFGGYTGDVICVYIVNYNYTSLGFETWFPAMGGNHGKT
jgi:hypothetical protein